MKTRVGLIFSLIILALIGSAGIATAAPATTQTDQADSITPYNGPIGPGNSLYGLKLAFENLDESFTFNQSERLEKQISHADLRLAELKREILENRTETADIALEQYRLKINQTDGVLEPVPINGTGPAAEFDETGLIRAREMIAKHQQVLEDLLQSHPNNSGLERAYENSRELEQKFERKIETARSNQQQTKQNRSSAPELLDNQTLQGPGQGRQPEGNLTGPIDESQLQDKNKFAGNTTQNKDRNELGINQSPQDTAHQQGSSSQGNDQAGQNGQQINNGNNKDNSGGDSRNTYTTQNQNVKNDNNAVNPAGEGNPQKTNGNGNVNPRSTGR
jgi:hypothetical protein